MSADHDNLPPFAAPAYGEGYRVHHDIQGWFVVAPDEDDPVDGYSIGFDGRPHFDCPEAAWRLAAEIVRDAA